MDGSGRRRSSAALSPLRALGWASAAALVFTATFGSVGALASETVVTPALGGGIVVDGDRSEWNHADLFAPMYRAGRTEKPVESDLYLRYDCVTGVLAVMVETRPGVVLADGDDFVKVDGAKRVGSPSIGTYTQGADGRGWEASLSLAEGSYSLNVHAQVLDGGSQTSAVEGRAIALVIACPHLAPNAPAEPSVEPSPDPSPDPSVEPSVEPDLSVAPSAQASVPPSSEPSQAPEPTPTPIAEPIGDPDPHDERNGPTEACECVSPAPSDPVVDEVLGVVGTPTTAPTLTPPPTDVLGGVPAAPTTDVVRLVLLGLALLIVAALVVTPSRPAAEEGRTR